MLTFAQADAQYTAAVARVNAASAAFRIVPLNDKDAFTAASAECRAARAALTVATRNRTRTARRELDIAVNAQRRERAARAEYAAHRFAAAGKALKDAEATLAAATAAREAAYAEYQAAWRAL